MASSWARWPCGVVAGHLQVVHGAVVLARGSEMAPEDGGHLLEAVGPALVSRCPPGACVQLAAL